MFASVKFKDTDTRSYTYACDLPVKPGDRVTVETKDGVKIVTVSEVNLDAPNFPCKPITGFAPAPAEDAQ